MHLVWFNSSDESRIQLLLKRVNFGGGRQLGALARDHYGSLVRFCSTILHDDSRLLAFEWRGTGGSLPLVLHGQRVQLRELAFRGERAAPTCIADRLHRHTYGTYRLRCTSK